MNKILPIIILVLSSSFMSSAFAANQFTPFLTIEEAQQHCPASNSLIFTPNNPNIPNSAGSIKGNNRIAFENIPAKTAIHPKNIDTNGFIADAQFRSADGLYGYIANNIVTCLYSYTTITNAAYHLTMRSK